MRMSHEGSLQNSPQNSHSSLKRSLVLGAIIIAFAACIVLLLKSMQPAAPVAEKSEKTWNVTVLETKTQTASPQLQLLGKVESPFSSILKAAISADIVDVPAREGQNVIAGDLLVVLDDREAKMTVTQREADIADIYAQILAENNRNEQDIKSLKQEKNLVALAEKAVTRESKLRKSNVTSEAKIDQSRQSLQQQKLSLQARELNITNHQSRVSQLEAKLARAQSQLALAQLDLERTRIMAPFNGVITQVHASPGGRVRNGDLLVELYDSQHIEIRAQIPNKMIGIIKQTLTHEPLSRAIAIAPGQEIPITLRRLAGITNAGGGGVDGIFTIPETNPSIVVGQTLGVTLQLPKIPDVFSLPAAAIYGENRVYKVVEGRLQSATVHKVGQQFTGNRLFHLVTSDALTNGDKVIITQLANAVTGLKVDIRN